MDKWDILDETMLDKWDKEKEGGEGNDIDYEDEDNWMKDLIKEDKD